MNFLVIGGGGFIGSHLVDYLIKVGNVVVYDNFSTGQIENLKEVNGKVKLVEPKNSSLKKLIKKADYVWNLAASVGVKYICENPKESIQNNLEIVKEVCAFAEKWNKPVLFTSTSEVYGNSKELPFKEENALSIGPSHQLRWSYSCAKLMGEFLMLSHNFPSVIVRPFNIVGPRQVDNYGMVLPIFIKRALKNVHLSINGDGKQARCFCYIDDIISPLYKLLVEEKYHNQIFNIGNPENIMTIRQLAEMVIERTNSNSKIIHNKRKINDTDVYVRVPSIDKIKKWMGWNPTTSVEEIIDVCANFYKQSM